MRLLDSINTWLFSTISQVFYSLATAHWYTADIHRYICIKVFFNILLELVRYLIEFWSIFSRYPFIIPLISGGWIRSKHGCVQRFFKFFTV